MNAAQLDPRFAPRIGVKEWPSPAWIARELALHVAWLASFIFFIWLAWAFWPDAREALEHGAALLDRALSL
jgi:hypothetical protein